MTFDIFDRVTEKAGRVCTSDVFYNVIDGEKIRRTWERICTVRAANDKEALAEAKRQLPVVTWQASFNGERKNERAIPSGLFMLDVDHIPDMTKFQQEIIEPIMSHQESTAELFGIVAIHFTPSGSGMRFVAKCPLGMTTIEGCQQWLAAQLGILTFDTACKDFARASYLVPLEDFLFLDKKGLWEDPPVNLLPVPNAETADKPASSSQPVVQQRTFSEEQKFFKYRDHMISEIALEWVRKHGLPHQGERHTYYYRLCTMFRYITDGDVGVLLAQLPDFGLSIAEREKEAEHATKRSMGTQIPYTFYKFLVNTGVIKVDEPHDEATAEEIANFAEEEKPKFPVLPPVFKQFCANCPPDFVYPTIVALLPVLGTLSTRLRARYLDGREHSTSFISVVFAPQSAGKSFARDIVSILTKDLRKHDEISILKEKQYKAELKLKKNSDQLPEDPHAPYRLVQAVISVPRLLQRQEDACGLHQLSFTEEIDTITKSNSGGSYAQKSDLYRQAFDNAEYGQDYISVDTFTGSVKLYYNILMLGTPKQLYKFFNDAENGLVSRCAFAELKNQEFASIPYFKPLTEKQLEEITRVMNRFEAMTYKRKNAQSEDYIVLPVVKIDDKMEVVREALAEWLERTRLQALKNNDIAFDVFRRRSAVKAFRLGMICVGMYSPKSLSSKCLKRIADFCVWFAGKDAEQSALSFGKMLNETNQQNPVKERQGLLQSLPETFSVAELIVCLRKRGQTTPPKNVLYRWNKAGLIKKNDDLTFTKLKQ